MRLQQKDSYESGSCPSAGTEFAGTLILDFPLLRTVTNPFLLSPRRLGLWYFVKAIEKEKDSYFKKRPTSQYNKQDLSLRHNGEKRKKLDTKKNAFYMVPFRSSSRTGESKLDENDKSNRASGFQKEGIRELLGCWRSVS